MKRILHDLFNAHNNFSAYRTYFILASTLALNNRIIARSPALYREEVFVRSAAQILMSLQPGALPVTITSLVSKAHSCHF